MGVLVFVKYVYRIYKQNDTSTHIYITFLGFSGSFRNQNDGMGGRGGFMDQAGGNRGGMNRYPDGGSRDFNRPNVPQFPGGSRGDRRPDFESLPPPPS